MTAYISSHILLCGNLDEEELHGNLEDNVMWYNQKTRSARKGSSEDKVNNSSTMRDKSVDTLP